MDAVAHRGSVHNDLERLVRELDVDHCLTGHLRVSATRVQVQAQLRRWPGGTVVISENASVAKKDLADLPHQLAKRIAEALSTRDVMTNGLANERVQQVSLTMLF
jgi:TolB-like protein